MAHPRAVSTVDSAGLAPTPWRTVRDSGPPPQISRNPNGRLYDVHYFRDPARAETFAQAHDLDPSRAVYESSQSEIWRVTLPAGIHPGGPELGT